MEGVSGRMALRYGMLITYLSPAQCGWGWQPLMIVVDKAYSRPNSDFAFNVFSCICDS